MIVNKHLIAIKGTLIEKGIYCEISRAINSFKNLTRVLDNLDSLYSIM